MCKIFRKLYLLLVVLFSGSEVRYLWVRNCLANFQVFLRQLWGRRNLLQIMSCLLPGISSSTLKETECVTYSINCMATFLLAEIIPPCTPPPIPVVKAISSKFVDLEVSNCWAATLSLETDSSSPSCCFLNYSMTKKILLKCTNGIR